MSPNPEAEPRNTGVPTQAEIIDLIERLSTDDTVLSLVNSVKGWGIDESLRNSREAIDALTRILPILPDTPNPATPAGDPPQVR
ncbi:MAG: hypothetical protein WCT01_04820 [Candidatus Shapirobacteria bacterium]|jgi:hypothetical protein